VYDGLAHPVGKYRSRLERDWANWFKLYGIEHEYVDAHWYDFRADEWFVEIKPHGQEYLEQAMARMPGAATLVVIQGSIGWYQCWMCVRHGNDIQYESVSLGDLFDLGVRKREEWERMDAEIRSRFGNDFWETLGAKE
jgi:hypothetical protein